MKCIQWLRTTGMAVLLAIGALAPTQANADERNDDAATGRKSDHGKLFSERGRGGPIADGFGTNLSGAPFRSTVTVPRRFDGPISDVWVEFHGLAHSWAADLRVRLIHPDGMTSMDLISRPGRGAGDTNISDTVGFGSDFVAANSYDYSDNGTILFLPHPFGGPFGGWQQGPSIPSGIYRPSSNPNPPDSNALAYQYVPVSFAATFGRKSAAGIWTLEITDWAGGDTGALDGWTLNICTGTCRPERDRVGDELFKLTAFDPGIGWEFGNVIALSGNTAIVGSPSYGGAGFVAGSAYLFDVTTGRQLALLYPANDVRDFYFYGGAVAISGNTALVGAPTDRIDVVGMGFSTGSVYVYDLSDRSNPVLRGKFVPSDATGNIPWRFGTAVAIDGDLAVVYAEVGGQAHPQGKVYLFNVRTGRELAKFNASDMGLDHDFGTRLAFSDDTLLVSAIGGGMYVFDLSNPRNPVKRFKLSISDAASSSINSIAISGKLALIGAGDFTSGAAYLFDVRKGVQLSKFTVPSGIGIGGSVAISGKTAVVGKPFVKTVDDLQTGAVFMFDVSDPRRPVEVLTLTASDAGFADWYGSSVALEGDTLLVGATQLFAGAGKVFVYRSRDDER